MSELQWITFFVCLIYRDVTGAVLAGPLSRPEISERNNYYFQTKIHTEFGIGKFW